MKVSVALFSAILASRAPAVLIHHRESSVSRIESLRYGCLQGWNRNGPPLGTGRYIRLQAPVRPTKGPASVPWEERRGYDLSTRSIGGGYSLPPAFIEGLVTEVVVIDGVGRRIFGHIGLLCWIE